MNIWLGCTLNVNIMQSGDDDVNENDDHHLFCSSNAAVHE